MVFWCPVSGPMILGGSESLHNFWGGRDHFHHGGNGGRSLLFQARFVAALPPGGVFFFLGGIGDVDWWGWGWDGWWQFGEVVFWGCLVWGLKVFWKNNIYLPAGKWTAKWNIMGWKRIFFKENQEDVGAPCSYIIFKLSKKFSGLLIPFRTSSTT